MGRVARAVGMMPRELVEDDGADHLLRDEAAASKVVFKRLLVACVQRLRLGKFDPDQASIAGQWARICLQHHNTDPYLVDTELEPAHGRRHPSASVPIR